MNIYKQNHVNAETLTNPRIVYSVILFNIYILYCLLI